MTLKRRNPTAAGPVPTVDPIENKQRTVRLQLRPLRHFLRRVLRELGLASESLAIRMIDDKEMARLNQTYRKKQGPTDVLSFPAIERRNPIRAWSRARKSRQGFLGDIAISPAVARRNARSLGRELPDELQILILHGALHLLGFDHEADRGEMERIELRLRRRLGIV
jgi:probable rRNA maturation factor